MITSLPHSFMTNAGVLYCCPIASPPPPSCTPGVICTNPFDHVFCHFAESVLMNPMTKSGCSAAMSIAALVYSPLAMVPLLDISASNKSPRPFCNPTDFNPSIMPLPGTMCAFVMWLQSAILCTPLAYCPTTVLPMSANLRSSKMRKLCFEASWVSSATNSSEKSGYKSQCVFNTQISGPSLSASSRSSAAVSTSALRHRFVFFVPIKRHNSLAQTLRVSSALSTYGIRFSTGASGISFPLALGPVWFALMNALTDRTKSALILPFFSNVTRTRDRGSTACNFKSFAANRASPPCSRSMSTTTSFTTRPTWFKGSTVSITEAPLVTKSSTTKQVCPTWKAPSIAFFVP
mmetsp:Transcript_13769/g.51552  ORF Transcript_13769/g.51552 Transcript_13769/m.51552 type:complete len:348 (+) Transcript_13769:209-1252(+)